MAGMGFQVSLGVIYVLYGGDEWIYKKERISISNKKMLGKPWTENSLQI